MGSAPQFGKDPIVISSQIVNALQTLVSRELDPLEIRRCHGRRPFRRDTSTTLFPMRPICRSPFVPTKTSVREKLLTGIRRIAEAQARSAGLPDDMMPEVVIEDTYTPSTYNDPEMTASRHERCRRRNRRGRGFITRPPSMGGEDFSRFGRTDDDIPTVLFWDRRQ